MKRSKSLLPLIVAVFSVLTILSCTVPPIINGDVSSDEPVVGITETMELNGSTIDQVAAISGDDTIGPILSVQLTNPTSGEVVATLPCGLVFHPGGGSEAQSLMMIQQIVIDIPAGQTVTVEPYVVCIESNMSIPSAGIDYQVGEMTSGDLLKFARCLCQENLPESITSNPTAFQDIFGIQIAVWVVADNISFDDFLGDMSSGEGAIGDLQPILGPMIEMLESASNEWLERCDIEIDG